MILDTCALLWLADGGGKLSKRTLKEINEAPAIFVSAISGFEIALKTRKGKLKLPQPTREWFGMIADHHGLTVLPIDLDICIAAAELPYIHDDPYDRFIIATAKENDIPVITTDERFEKYGVVVLS